MHFVDRKAKYPGRWTMMKSDGTSEIVTLIRNDEPVVDGTPMNADTLNTLSDVAGADIAKEKAEAAATVASTAKDAAELAANSSEKSKDAAAKTAAEMEDALCEQDIAADERLAAIEDSLCELDAAVNK